MTVSYSYFEFHQGLADATSLMVGQQIGKMDAKKAYSYFKIFLVATMGFIASSAGVYLIFRK